jgi:uncharacterized protein YqgV (UPF0045/DUF77 family)
MIITADISMYPLDENFIEPITKFIKQLRTYDGLEIVTNQLSTQVKGDFDQVGAAINDCIRVSMEGEQKVVFVTKFLNADLDISNLPQID